MMFNVRPCANVWVRNRFVVTVRSGDKHIAAYKYLNKTGDFLEDFPIYGEEAILYKSRREAIGILKKYYKVKVFERRQNITIFETVND